MPASMTEFHHAPISMNPTIAHETIVVAQIINQLLILFMVQSSSYLINESIVSKSKSSQTPSMIS